MARPLHAWAVIALLLGLAQRFLSRSSTVLTYATQAVLPWYIHQSPIVDLGYLFIGSNLPLCVEALVVLLGTAVRCAAIYELLIRVVSIPPLFDLPFTGPLAHPIAEPR